MRTTITRDKRCVEDAQYSACFYISPNDNIRADLDRTIIGIDMSCFGSTRKQAKARLKNAISVLIENLEAELEELK